MELNSSLREVKGIGDKTEKLFQKMGVYTVGDILLHFPRTYSEYPSPTTAITEDTDSFVAFYGRLRTPARTRKTRHMDITLATVFSTDTSAECVWFRMPYLSKQLKTDCDYIFYGNLQREKNKYKLEQPAVYTPEKYEMLRSSLQPVYPLTKGLSNTIIRKTMLSVFDEMQALEDTYLPENILKREGFPDYITALKMLHFPNSFDELVLGRNRLVYQEFFYYILHNKMQESMQGCVENTVLLKDLHMVEAVTAALPFSLTNGQRDALAQIYDDLNGAWVSQRLIQGDVGSGKTMVAFLSMLAVVSNGYQAVMMAPTEVLANQHYETFSRLCEKNALPYNVVCLTGSTPAKQRKEIFSEMEHNDALFIIGTHALIQEKVTYKKLGLVITDEQHRFGVKQREALSNKGNTPHMLVMSATPIPRTLSMILYGNMHISVIKDMPANRLPIKTCVIKEDLRQTAYQMIGSEIKKGHQAYIICPLVEASDKTDAENVMEYREKLMLFFGDYVTVGILHGKMKANEKNEIMERFSRGEIQILVSTTVIEVGIHVENATIIMIENADRFGLAQLHQLRGRVGRGAQQSYCILMDKGKDGKTSQRLEIMHKSNDGFYIAAEDLKLRGPGDFYGIRQSGDLNFRIADIIGDADLLQLAAKDVSAFLQKEEPLADGILRRNIEYFEKENRLVL